MTENKKIHFNPHGGVEALSKGFTGHTAADIDKHIANASKEILGNIKTAKPIC